MVWHFSSLHSSSGMETSRGKSMVISSLLRTYGWGSPVLGFGCVQEQFQTLIGILVWITSKMTKGCPANHLREKPSLGDGSRQLSHSGRETLSTSPYVSSLHKCVRLWCCEWDSIIRYTPELLLLLIYFPVIKVTREKHHSMQQVSQAPWTVNTYSKY